MGSMDATAVSTLATYLPGHRDSWGTGVSGAQTGVQAPITQSLGQQVILSDVS